MENFLELDFKISPVEPGRELLIAMLSGIGYDSFQETNDGVKAYILEEDFDEAEVTGLHLFQSGEFEIQYEKDKLANKNWNEEWESNYEPIFIDDKIHIRAPFHKSDPTFQYEILITPKMSFGTGHHQTTRLMSRLMLEMDFEGKTVLDMGTGTGVLAILAEKLKAKSVVAIDNFEWAVESTIENYESNQCSTIEALHGDAKLIEGMKFDIVLANINRNVLMQDMAAYLATLPSGGLLLLSGFFERDFDKLNTQAEKLGARLYNKTTEDKWMSCCFQKL